GAARLPARVRPPGAQGQHLGLPAVARRPRGRTTRRGVPRPADPRRRGRRLRRRRTEDPAHVPDLDDPAPQGRRPVRPHPPPPPPPPARRRRPPPAQGRPPPHPPPPPRPTPVPPRPRAPLRPDRHHPHRHDPLPVQRLRHQTRHRDPRA